MDLWFLLFFRRCHCHNDRHRASSYTIWSASCLGFSVRSLVVATDIKKVVSLVKKTRPYSLDADEYLSDAMIKDTWFLMDRDWEVQLGHIHLEGNQVADIMANFGAFQSDLFKKWNSPPPSVTDKLAADSLGVSG